FERRDRALARLAGLLGREGRLDLGLAPAGRGGRDVGDRHGGDVDAGLLLRLSLGLGLLGLRLRGCLRGLPADRLDLDAGEAAAVAAVLLVAGAALVLADADLLAELVPDDARGHGGRRREIRRAVPADEQDARLERLALVDLEAVDEQPLALLDAVLLTAEADDRVTVHGMESAGSGPRGVQCS